MSILCMSKRIVQIYRQTAFLVAPATAGLTHTPAGQPPNEAVIQVRLKDGTSNSGTVTVSGDVDGAPDSETLIFTSGGFLQTTKKFLPIALITTAGLVDEATIPTIEVKSISPTGAPLHIQQLHRANLPVHLDHRRTFAGWRGETSGVAEMEQPWLGIDFVLGYIPKEGDIVLDDQGLEWLVVSTPMWRGSLHKSHYEAFIMRREDSLT